MTKNILWLDLGAEGSLLRRGNPFDRWHDHGMGLLRTILHRQGLHTSSASTRNVRSLVQLAGPLRDHDLLLMNVRSHTFTLARQAARLFKKTNPRGTVVTGGVHASVAPEEILKEECFDFICQGSGERIIADLVRDPSAFDRLVEGRGASEMDEWPFIDRHLWTRPRKRWGLFGDPWPLEPGCGWAPAPVATVLTNRVCPWNCSFCNEKNYIAPMRRRSVESVIEELNMLDEQFGPLGSVVIHDSIFFQNTRWLEEWLEKYPVRSRKRWPYWAAARSDSIRRKPELFTALVKETNWNTISIGFESGSDRVLNILNKGCTSGDHAFAVELVNRIGDELESAGKVPPKVWANIILAVPGEERVDALETMALLSRIKRVLPSISFFSPYPGSVLGERMINEGRSLLSEGDYNRDPGQEKVAGIDYDFYRRLMEPHAARSWRSMIPFFGKH